MVEFMDLLVRFCFVFLYFVFSRIQLGKGMDKTGGQRLHTLAFLKGISGDALDMLSLCWSSTGNNIKRRMTLLK